MVKQALKEKNMQQKFSIVWVIITLLLICLINFYQWLHLSYQKENRLQLQASHLTYKLDHFIDSIFKPIDLLTLDYNIPQDCQSILLPKLQTLVFNSPVIAGIIVYNANKNLVCTTFDPTAPLPNSHTTQPLLLGPMRTKQVKNEFFLLQRYDHGVYVGIYLLKPTLESLIQVDYLDFKSLGLYDSKKKQIVLDNNTLTTFTSQTSQKGNTLLLPLDSLKNMSLVAHYDNLSFYQNLVIHLLLTSLPLLFLSWLLHNYFQQIMNKHFSITTALTNALKMQQFFPAYQPLFCTKTKQFYGAEVLIRWVNNENELIMPDSFIEDAECSGLIVPITLQLVEKTFSECSKFLQKEPSFHLGFNITPNHFNSETFFHDFDNLRLSYAISSKQIMLELTERQLFTNMGQEIFVKVADLKKKGYLLAIDDFGTGHASINYLQHFPFDFLKIDKLFIQSIGTGAITETLNEVIITMANSLKLKIIAEGVETQQQFDYLQAKQVDFLQGWFIAKAMSFTQLEELIMSKRKNDE